MLFTLIITNILALNVHDVTAKCLPDNIFDYIVVGSGSSGGVVASRLAEDKDVNVLLLEAGGLPSFNSFIPLITYRALKTEVDWQFFTVPQKHCCNIYEDQKVLVSGGKMLGGTSSLNFMGYTRGNVKDYDGWAEKGNKGWAYDDVLKYFRKLEDYQIPTTPETEPWHNKGGPITVEHASFKTPMIDAFLDSARELNFSVVDLNSNQSLGFTYFPVSTRKGVRCGTYLGYLQPAIRNYRNFKLVTNALVTRLIIDESKRVTGVEYEKDGLKCVAKVGLEVILSAGSFQTPKILMLSGIGPADELKKHEIPLVLDLPGVGQNLQDHGSGGYAIFKLNTTNVTCNSVRYETISYLNQWQANGTGPMSVPMSREGLGVFQSQYVPKEDDGSPDFEIAMFSDSIGKLGRKLVKQEYITMYPPDDQESVTLVPILLRPKSRGSVTLQSKDPHAPPAIDPNYLSDEHDVNVLVEDYFCPQFVFQSPRPAQSSTITVIQKIISTSAFQHYGPVLYGADHILPDCAEAFKLGKGEYFKCLIKVTFTTVYHPTSTCIMGPKSNTMAVVDHKLRVYGMRNLRIADASIMPAIVAAHPNVPCMMIGEKAADLIKQTRKDYQQTHTYKSNVERVTWTEEWGY